MIIWQVVLFIGSPDTNLYVSLVKVNIIEIICDDLHKNLSANELLKFILQQIILDRTSVLHIMVFEVNACTEINLKSLIKMKLNDWCSTVMCATSKKEKKNQHCIFPFFFSWGKCLWVPLPSQLSYCKCRGGLVKGQYGS